MNSVRREKYCHEARSDHSGGDLAETYSIVVYRGITRNSTTTV